MEQFGWLKAVAHHFEAKWLCCSLPAKDALFCFLEQHRGLQAEYLDSDIADAFFHIKKRYHFLADGTCLSVWAILHESAPTDFVSLMNWFCCSPEMISTQVVDAKIYGKESWAPVVCEVRAILPLPPLMQIAD